MLINFKPQFRPFIENGTKRHTIRGNRKDGQLPHVGEVLHLYTGLRQPGAQLIGRWPCTGTQPIIIMPLGESNLQVALEGIVLSLEETALFLWRDGFREYLGIKISEGNTMSIAAARAFWNEPLSIKPMFAGHVYHWAFDQPFMGPTKPTRPHKADARR